MTLVEKLGTALYESHGKLCEELINAGYDLDNYYDGSAGWGDFDKVICMVAHVRGAQSYYEYEVAFGKLAREGDHLVSPRMYARLTGNKAPRMTQTERTKRYRQNINDELAELRALRWIDEHLEQATNYINSKNLTDKQ